MPLECRREGQEDERLEKKGKEGKENVEEVRKEGVGREIKETQKTYVINSVQLCISETIVR